MRNLEADVMRLGPADRYHFGRILAEVKAWGARHPALIGLAEMSAGAAILTAGIQSGAAELGVHVLLTTGGKLGALAAGGPAALAAYALGSIGVAALGGAVAVPAAVVRLCGTVLAGLAGYALGDLIQKIVDPVTALDMLAPASLVALGVALLLDGARRCTKDRRVAAAASAFRDGVIFLGKVVVGAVLSTLTEVEDWMADLARRPALGGTTVAFVAGSAVAAKAAAAASVTVLGSSTLGSIGLGLGLVSAPLWPVVAAGGAAAALCYSAWWSFRDDEHRIKNSRGEQ